MEAVLVPYSSVDQSVSPYKKIKSPRKGARAFISKPSENLSPTNILRGGLLLHRHPPPPLSSSYPPSAFSHPFQQHQQQPPLLPLPTTITHQYSLPSRTRKPNNKRRDQSLTPKKSKPTKREDPNKQDSASTRRAVSECLIVASTKPLGPDPSDLPKDVSRVFSSTAAGVKSFGKVTIEELEMFSGTVFSLAPPPSSLPLPKFSLRPKLCCNAEAAGIDAGATDNLRRMLRLL
ncbi:uncharacterized protein LOC133871122 [Alnus glutinosa]|uniref:uncharacterized protein LOC133871122 n=1 Tax=Alnus glutinosa TaxID=3517 RepID=UPI002D770357|nr:uncharacterized protein LOC133871122 [Alnus glutinosa]